MTPPPLPDEAVQAQIDKISIDHHHPLIICDADEVLLQFIVGLEDYLECQGLWLDLTSYAITGNIKQRDTGEPVSDDDVKTLLEDFFATQTEHIKAMPGAAVALQRLTQQNAQIVVLSNLPSTQRAARQRCLQAQGMDYPVITNQGLKGAAVAYLSRAMRAPVFFLDDLYHHLTDAFKWREDLYYVHFIADSRLAGFAKKALKNDTSTTKIVFQETNWPDTYNKISKLLDKNP